MTSNREAFVLLTLLGVTLRSRRTSISHSGTLAIESISIPAQVQAAINRNMFLILCINSEEIPLDPRRVITLTASAEGRTYVFSGTDSDPEELELHVDMNSLTADYHESQRREDVDTLEGIFSEYAQYQDISSTYSEVPSLKDTPQDYRGQLVLVHQDTGDIIGEVDRKISVREDAALSRPAKGHEDDPVVIEIPQDEDGEAIEVFARTIPADEQDWITTSAKLVSQGISQTTNLLVNVISSASTYYIARSSPSPSPSLSLSSSSSGSGPAKSQSKAVAFISSPRTQTGLSHAHALTAQAVKVSGKTLKVIDGMISRILFGGSGIASSSSSTASSSVTNFPAPNLAPPPYSKNPYPPTDAKPPLPPRLGSDKSGSEKPSLPPRSNQVIIPAPPPPLPPRALTKKAKLILSADLILATLDQSAKQLIEVGGRSATRVVGHSYGADAAQSTALIAGTVRNVALVYIDMRGVGRKAIIKRVGKQYVKSKMGSR